MSACSRRAWRLPKQPQAAQLTASAVRTWEQQPQVGKGLLGASCSGLHPSCTPRKRQGLLVRNWPGLASSRLLPQDFPLPSPACLLVPVSSSWSEGLVFFTSAKHQMLDFQPSWRGRKALSQPHCIFWLLCIQMHRFQTYDVSVTGCHLQDLPE